MRNRGFAFVTPRIGHIEPSLFGDQSLHGNIVSFDRKALAKLQRKAHPNASRTALRSPEKTVVIACASPHAMTMHRLKRNARGQNHLDIRKGKPGVRGAIWLQHPPFADDQILQRSNLIGMHRICFNRKESHPDAAFMQPWKEWQQIRLGCSPAKHGHPA